MERSQSRKVSSGHGSSRHAHGRHRHHSHRESPQPHGQPRYVRECSCGNGLACSGMAQAFRLLGDPRCYYVELPRYRKDPPAYKYIFRNNLRAAYIRHLVKQNPKLDSAEFDSPHRRYVALHHFHPTVVRTFYNNPLTKAQKHKVPISITEHELEELDMELSLEDRILSFSGKPTGGYFFVPNYSHSQAHEDLKALIRATRMSKEFPTSKQQKIKEESSIKDAERQSIPKNIDISDTDDTCFKEVPHSLSEISKDQNSPSPKKQTPPKSTPENHDDDDNENHDDDDDDDDDSSTEHVPRNASNQEDDQDFKLREEDTPAESDFDNLWDDETPGEVGGIQTIIEADEADHSESTDGHDHVAELHNSTKDHIPQTIIETNEEEDGEGQKEPTTVKPINKSTPPARDADHPWGTPKYRKNRPDLVKIKSSGPAQFIDPTVTSDIRPSASIDSEEEPPVAPSQALNLDSAQATQSVTKVVPKDNFGSDKGIATPDLSSDRPGVLSADPPGKTPQKPLRVKTSLSPPHRRKAAEYTDFDETKSAASDDSDKAVQLKHQLPGTDPTLRIQMHNDLIAWESKRRSDLTKDLEFNREQWKAAREILEDCIAEVEFAERLVLGFSKAGILFADALEAMYDDNFLDDSGNTVSNSFVQNRLAKRRSVHEYSIESASKAFTAQAGQSTLLNSIIESQLALANIFKESSQHMQEEILPEINEIRADIQASARGLESLGDSMIAELKRSEIEVKNIWDVFDAMVTGDLMEYSVHGSMHGGSGHGGSLHSPFSAAYSGQSSSVPGFLTPRSEGEKAPIVSSLNSPLVKSTFKQLGGVEDGWLIEMYYKTSVTYQRSVVSEAGKKLAEVFKEIAELEETRCRKLHQVMLAFVPRQRRLYVALPEQMKGVLDDLVGLRIDEESLQTLVDESIKARSHNHLKNAGAHRSSIMNRSRLKVETESSEQKVEQIESLFGNPFESSMVLLSKVLQLKPGGLGGMVNSNWKNVLAVVTKEGNFHVFLLVEANPSPKEAFKSLYPPMTFESVESWTRKVDIIKSLTPTTSLDLKKCSISISTLQKRQFDVVEERPAATTGGSRFMNAVNAGTQRQKKCTLRLASATEASEWVSLLERTKKALGAMNSTGTRKTNRFRF